MSYDLTTGNLFRRLISFSLPYFLSYFMQSLYGLVDLFVIGLYNGTATVAAVSIGSQVMHMLTVMIVGLAMGATVRIGFAVGQKDQERAAKTIGNSVTFFACFALICMVLLLICTNGIAGLMQTPPESMKETIQYLRICFAGIPFVVAYNVISSIFRGKGDSKTPMVFVAIACFVNIVLDFLLIGGFHWGAVGAAWGTVLAQAVSVGCALLWLRRRPLGFPFYKESFRPKAAVLKEITVVGGPIALQDGLIQVAFLLITVIANTRGVTIAAGVGIVEKIISFLFLVPSSMLSSISAMTAQNIGAGKFVRVRKTLNYGFAICLAYGIIVSAYCWFFPETLLRLFSDDPDVIIYGCQYLSAYALDCVFAGIHFCFSGYYCGCGHSGVSFFHNLISIMFVRIPGTYLAAQVFPASLFPMGLAAPYGSILSALICVIFYFVLKKRGRLYPMMGM